MRYATAILLAALAFATQAASASPDSYRPYQIRARTAICKTFGGYCQEALSVSWCESRWTVTAHNGQYLGLFQMGSYARSKYGHSNGAWGQSRAARRYFIDSGRDWSPWSCKP